MKGIIKTVIAVVFIVFTAVIIKPEVVDTVHDFYEEAVEADHIEVYQDDGIFAIAFVDDSGHLKAFGWDFKDIINDILHNLRD